MMILLCLYFIASFTEYMLAGKTLLDYTNLFSPDDYKENDRLIYILRAYIASLKFRLKK